jgi:hypothetical protein
MPNGKHVIKTNIEKERNGDKMVKRRKIYKLKDINHV